MHSSLNSPLHLWFDPVMPWLPQMRLSPVVAQMIYSTLICLQTLLCHALPSIILGFAPVTLSSQSVTTTPLILFLHGPTPLPYPHVTIHSYWYGDNTSCKFGLRTPVSLQYRFSNLLFPQNFGYIHISLMYSFFPIQSVPINNNDMFVKEVQRMVGG